MELSLDVFPNGTTLYQPVKGFRSGSDALLLSESINFRASSKIIDIGAGVGAISIGILQKNPTVKITALEYQSDYCQILKKNMLLNGVEHNIDIINGNLLDIMQLLSPDSFDYVVTNPPFYDVGTCRLPLDDSKKIAHCGIINLDNWLKKSLYVLRNGGYLAFILRTDRLGEVYTILNKKVGDFNITPIFTGKANYAKRIIVTCRKGYSGGTKILKNSF